MAPFLLVFAACVFSVVSTAVGCLYLILRPGGLMERLDAVRDLRLTSLSEASTDLSGKMAKLESQVAANQHLVTTVTTALQTRMVSFESRFGKYAAKTEKAQLIDEAFATARQQTNGI